MPPLIRGLLILGLFALAPLEGAPDSVVFDFSQTKDWKLEGSAFRFEKAGNYAKDFATPGQECLTSGSSGLEATGEALSPSFRINQKFLNYLVGGDRTWPEDLGLALLIDGQVVRRSSGCTPNKRYSPAFCWGTWDVSPFIGKQARIQVIDHVFNGQILLTDVQQSDERKTIPTDASIRGQETLRPQYHYSPPDGRLNDPNGCFYYQGLWHLMYQRLDLRNARIVWGYALSKDLIHWEEQKPPLPKSNPEGAYASGGAGVDSTNASGMKSGGHPPIFVCFTLFPPKPKGTETKMTYNLAYSLDGGKTWELGKNNPLWIPEFHNDRDGMLFHYGPTNEWFIIGHLSHDNEREKSVFGIFKSKGGMKDWELIQTIATTPPLWECPDMFELPVDGNAANKRWVLTEARGDYMVGTFDGKQFKPETAGKILTHYGGQFYAAQTFKNGPDGRVVQLAWMNAGKPDAGSYPGMPFINQMSFPTELSLRTTPEGIRLFWWPVKEIEGIRAKRVALSDFTVGSQPKTLEGIAAGSLDLRLIVEPGNAAEFVITLREQRLIYDVKKQQLTGRRTPLPESAFLNWDKQMMGEKIERSVGVPVPLRNGRVDFRILVDRTSVDVFLNEGANHFTFNIWPDADQAQVQLSASGSAAKVVSAEAYELKP